MQYKTIVLELLKQRPDLHEQLRLTRRLLATVETCAVELRQSHHAWMEILASGNPSHPIQIEAEAMQRAIKELEDRLPSVFPFADREPFNLDAAMAFIHKPTPDD